MPKTKNKETSTAVTALAPNEPETTPVMSASESTKQVAPSQPKTQPEKDTSASQRFMMVKTGKPKDHPKNAEIYGDLPLPDEFVASIRQHKIYAPIVVTKDFVVISGHKRLAAAKLLKFEEVPVIVADFPDELTALEALLDGNQNRVKTNVQITREYASRKEIEAERAKQRQGTNSADKDGKKLSQAETGKARDKAAEGTSLSGVSLDNGLKVIKAVDDLRTKGETDKAEELETALNRGFHPALKLGRVMGVIEAAKTSNTAKPAGSGNGTGEEGDDTTEDDEVDPCEIAQDAADKVHTYVKQTQAADLKAKQRKEWIRLLKPVVEWFQALTAAKEEAK